MTDQQQPAWVHSKITRIKISGADSWKDRFIALRKRYLKVAGDNLKLQEKLNQARKKRESERFDKIDDRPAEYDEDLKKREQALIRTGILETEDY